ncbi:MAG: response regulator transcription factor [Chloroflexi bacterium]|nr:response regulator transcription factor [Chloroflexota bacterium]
MMQTVMIVDDEARIISMISAYLRQGGYRVMAAADGREALLLARQEKPDLILLDIMMPEMSGLEFMRLYKQESRTPIILLTAKVEEEDKVMGLDLGADDYVTKPFGMHELMARVRAALRRAEIGESALGLVLSGAIRVERSSRTVYLQGRRIDLTRTEFDLLDTLISNPGRVFSRANLLDSLRTSVYEINDRIIDLHVKNLRAKLEDDPRQPHYIETVYGVGYRFLPE